jgi:hypothetical protein
VLDIIAQILVQEQKQDIGLAEHGNNMKINEIITESSRVDLDKDNDGIPDSHQTATPGMRSHKNLDNSSPYAPWRFAAHFLGGADGKNPYEHEPSKEGPNGQSLVTVSYTDGDEAIIKQAEKAFGVKATRLTPTGSSETKSVNNVSPHRKVGDIQRVVKTNTESKK